MLDKELENLLDANITTDQILDKIEISLKEKDDIIQSETSTEEDKLKAKSEKARIEQILVNALKMQKEAEHKKQEAKNIKVKRQERTKAKTEHRKRIRKAKVAKKRNNK